MKKIDFIAQQQTIDGTWEYVVYYDDGSVEFVTDLESHPHLRGHLRR